MTVWGAFFAMQGVSLSVPPTPLYLLEPQLAEALGREVEVAAALENEVVVIHVRDVSAQDLQINLAEAVCGEWVDEGNRLLLRRDPDEETRREKQVVEELGQAIAKDLANELKAVRKFSPEQIRISLAEDDIYRIPTPGPGKGLEILQTIPANELARAMLFKPTVYASHPTRLQTPLSASAMPKLRQFEAEWSAIIRDLEPLGLEVKPSARAFYTGALPDTSGAEFVYRINTVDRPFRNYEAQWITATEPGPYERIWLNAEGYVPDRMPHLLSYERDFTAQRVNGFTSPHEKILVDQRRAWVARESQLGAQLAEDGWKAVSTIPRTPFADLYGDAFARFAEAEGVQLCALVSDAWLAVSPSDFPKHLKPNGDTEVPGFFNSEIHPFLSDFRDLVEWRKVDGWLTCRALVPAWERDDRLSHKLYNRLASRIEDRSVWPTLTTVLRDATWRNYFLGPARAHHRALAGLGRFAAGGSNSVIAELTPATLEGFLDGRPRRFGSLPLADQNLLIHAAVFGRASWYDMRTDSNETEEVRPVRQVASRRLAEPDIADAPVEMRDNKQELYVCLSRESTEPGIRPIWQLIRSWEHKDPADYVVFGKVMVHQLTVVVRINEFEIITASTEYLEYQFKR